MKQQPNTVTSQAAVSKSLWEVAKTKKEAYFSGKRVGIQEGQDKAEFELRQKTRALDERKIQLDSLKNITQAGAEITTAMTKALLSLNRDL